MPHIIDTADWHLTVPLKPSIVLDGSRLRATITPINGGPPVAHLDSDDDTITWVTGTDGRASALTVVVSRAMRGTWLADALTTLVFDVHRTVSGSDVDEGIGRSAFLVLPASDSTRVTAYARVRPLLVSPASGALPALQVGPQGPPGERGADGVPPDLQDLATLFDNGLL